MNPTMPFKSLAAQKAYDRKRYLLRKARGEFLRRKARFSRASSNGKDGILHSIPVGISPTVPSHAVYVAPTLPPAATRAHVCPPVSYKVPRVPPAAALARQMTPAEEYAAQPKWSLFGALREIRAMGRAREAHQLPPASRSVTPPNMLSSSICSGCNGTGTFLGGSCPSCRGTGKA